MNREPKVSVVLPTYNRSLFIERAIKSILSQSYEDFELLIIDDGSTDNTAEIISKYSMREPRILYLKNENNLGIQKTLNKGLREAKGKYIARIDDDDEWIDNDKLKAQVDFLDTHQDYVLVGTGKVVFNERGQELYRVLSKKTDIEIRNKILTINCFSHATVVFVKEAAIRVGGYDESEETRHVEDYDLWLKMGKVGELANLPMFSYKRLVGGDTICNENRIEQYRKFIKLKRKYKNDYPNYRKSLLKGYFQLIFYGFLNLESLAMLKHRLTNKLTGFFKKG